MKKHIPNLLTCLNLFSGCIAAIMAFNGEYLWVVVWIVIAALFDFSDGFAARLLKAHSPIGKDLDSLADMVSFGFVPGITVFAFLQQNMIRVTANETVGEFLPYLGFLLTIFSALRLAKFNIDKRQTESFIGLNTPANTLFWVCFIYGMVNDLTYITTGHMYTILVGIIVFSILLISEIPMFSLKIKSLKWKNNESRYFLLLFGLALIVIFRSPLAISGIILMYIALSLISNRTKIKE